jgi:hypothetical protein
MARVKKTNFITQVFQYGIVPLDDFPKEGIEELFRQIVSGMEGS